MAASKKLDYGKLFDIWADFDDAESSSQVSKIIAEEGLGPVDAVSFAAFCYGYEKAAELTGQAL